MKTEVSRAEKPNQKHKGKKNWKQRSNLHFYIDYALETHKPTLWMYLKRHVTETSCLFSYYHMRCFNSLRTVRTLCRILLTFYRSLDFSYSSPPHNKMCRTSIKDKHLEGCQRAFPPYFLMRQPLVIVSIPLKRPSPWEHFLDLEPWRLTPALIKSKARGVVVQLHTCLAMVIIWSYDPFGKSHSK